MNDVQGPEDTAHDADPTWDDESVDEAWTDEAPVVQADVSADAGDDGDVDAGEDLEPVADEPEPVADEPEPVPAPEPTGHSGVDDVLASLAGLEARSVHEHVAVFEAAHTALRRALDEDLADDELADDELPGNAEPDVG